MAVIPGATPMFMARTIEEDYDWQNILVYGDAGTGKTFLAASSVLVPEMQDVLFCSLESGEKSLKEILRLARQMKIDPKRLLVAPITTYKQFSQVFEMLKIHLAARDRNDVNTLRRLEAQIKGMNVANMSDEELAALIPNPLKFRTVIIDSLTEAQKYCMYQLLGIDPAKQKLDEEPDSAEFKDWGSSREMIGFLVRRFRDLPIHTVFTASELCEQDAKKIIHCDINLPGKLSTDVRSMVDTVGYLMAAQREDGSVLRRLILVKGNYGAMAIKAKHRYGTNLKGAWIDNPMMEQLYKMGL